ncbi:MAG: signal recognition particle protein [Acidobacteriota bacterium]|jgi:signal recognition particle subunit SRP54
MFEGLSDKLQGVFRKLRGEGHLSEANIREGLREIRLALLEADVHFQVVKDLIARVRERALGEEVLRSLTPGQQFVKVVRDGLVEVLGEGAEPLRRPPRMPGTVMMVGLQGSGKTTTSGKLGLRLKGEGRNPLLVPCDVYRPAATDQLRTVARGAGLAFHEPEEERDPLAIARGALKAAAATGFDIVVLDTAGRLHIDEALMQELQRLQSDLQPFEVLYVADAMTGQDAVRSAGEFHRQLALSGVVLTKMDGDARGGAALSIKFVTGVPIKLVGTGEKLEDLETFHPERMASRILGMGDVLSLIERAESVYDEEESRRLQKKLRSKDSLSLADFRDQLRKLRRMGPLSQIIEMIPGLGPGVQAGDADEGELRRVEAIIDSMTPAERHDHTLLNGSRKKRIARGSGTSVQDVNRLLKQFVQMRKMMKGMAAAGRGGRKLPGLPFRR